MCLSDCPVKPVARPRQKPAVCKSRMWSSHGLRKHHALQIGIPKIQVIKTQQNYNKQWLSGLQVPRDAVSLPIYRSKCILGNQVI